MFLSVIYLHSQIYFNIFFLEIQNYIYIYTPTHTRARVCYIIFVANNLFWINLPAKLKFISSLNSLTVNPANNFRMKFPERKFSDLSQL